MTLGNVVGDMCAQGLVFVDVFMVNSSVVTAEYKEKEANLKCVGAIYPCYSVNIWTLCFLQCQTPS